MSACGCTDPECRLTGCKAEKAMKNPQQLVGAPIVESLAGGEGWPYVGKTFWITYENPPPDPRDEEIARLKEALRPFARVAIFDIGFDEADKDLFRPMSAKTAEAPLLTVGDFRRARAAWNGESPADAAG